MKYRAEVELGTTPSECAFTAIVPDLPGCFTTGESIEELHAHLLEAATSWLEATREQGDSSHPDPTGFILEIELPATASLASATAAQA